MSRHRPVETLGPLGLLVLATGCTQTPPDDPSGFAQTGATAMQGTQTDGGGTQGSAATDTADATQGSDESSSSGAFKFDLGAPDVGGAVDPCGDFSYIWIANSAQSTVSKLNTQTMVEEGRYRVHPQEGNPSRTSVSLSGDVAIANRWGGVTKVYANSDDCMESNGTAGLQTSTGAADVLDWGDEECIAWHVPMNHTTQRPIAWSPGQRVPGEECEYMNERVWTTGADVNTQGSVVTTVLDGETGAVVQEIPMPDIVIGAYGPYGAAFDPSGNYWFIDSGNDGPEQELVRVDPNDFSYDVWITPPEQYPYGFAVDTNGRPWISGTGTGILRFDPESETFALIEGREGLGMQQDGQGRMWVAAYGELDFSGGFPIPWEGVFGFDIDSMQLLEEIQLPASGARGVSIDFQGNVWVVDALSAFRLDPMTQSFDNYAGLNGPYTYSDMTGWGLANVTQPEG